MSIKRVKLMRGVEAERFFAVPVQGEPIMTTDELKLYLGDGNKAGGFMVNADNTIAIWPDQTDATKKLSLAWWIAYFNGNEATVRIPRGTHEVLYDMTVPENICLEFDKGGIFDIAGGKTLTVNGPIAAGLWQIFDGSGTVNGTPNVAEIYPEWFGAVGDGATDDTDAIEKAINFGGVISFRHTTYNISDALTYTGTRDIHIKGNDALLNNTGTEIHYGLYINPSANISHCTVDSLKIDGNNNLAVAIMVDTRTKEIENISVSNCKISNLDNGSVQRGTAGINVDALYNSITKIDSNHITDVTRTSSNPGIIASVGISVKDLNSLAYITNNYVFGISSPSGSADSDGIHVFSNNRLDASVRQTSSAVISGNNIQQCNGRFIKLQCANTKVHNNYFSNVGIETITEFTVVDAQAGGVSIYQNTYRHGAGTGGGSATFTKLQFKATGDYENISTVKDNIVILEQSLPYFSRVAPDGACYAIAIIEGNIVGDKNSSYRCVHGCYCGTDEDILKLHVVVKNNQIALGSGYLLRLSTEAAALMADSVTGPLLADKTFLEITNNNNIKPDLSGHVLHTQSSYPYLKFLSMHSNTGLKQEFSGKSMNLVDLPVGSCFYFKTDGASDGITDAPNNYDCNVFVNKISKNLAEIITTAGNRVIILPETPAQYFMFRNKQGATSVADGGTITHGFDTTPSVITVTPSVAGELVAVTAKDATTFTVAIKKPDGSTGTTQTVYWYCG